MEESVQLKVTDAQFGQCWHTLLFLKFSVSTFLELICINNTVNLQHTAHPGSKTGLQELTSRWHQQGEREDWVNVTAYVGEVNQRQVSSDLVVGSKISDGLTAGCWGYA